MSDSVVEFPVKIYEPLEGSGSQDSGSSSGEVETRKVRYDLSKLDDLYRIAAEAFGFFEINTDVNLADNGGNALPLWELLDKLVTDEFTEEILSQACHVARGYSEGHSADYIPPELFFSRLGDLMFSLSLEALDRYAENIIFQSTCDMYKAGKDYPDSDEAVFAKHFDFGCFLVEWLSSREPEVMAKLMRLYLASVAFAPSLDYDPDRTWPS